MRNNYYFIFAPISSGSTFFTRVINSFENTVGIPDPLFEYFKFLIQKNNNKQISEKKFIDHCYFSKNLENYFHNCENINFQKKTNKKELKLITKRIVENSYFTPEFSKKLNFLSGRTYKDVFFELIKKLKKIYTISKTRNICLKHAWIEDISISLIKNFSNSRLIFLIRDPRDAIISQYKNNVFDILMLARHHRKHLAYAIFLKKKYNNRVIIIKYENLVNKKKKTLNELSKFINEIPKINKISKIKWKTNAVFRWKSQNSKNLKLIKLITYLLNFELKYFGYEKKIKKKNVPEFNYLFKDCFKKVMNKYNLKRELKNEISRYKIFFKKNKINKILIKKNFLFLDVYNTLKKNKI